ncbi:MAG TPA: hypothetical protein VIH99_05305 [Bdellovibrionota bacterium]
MKAFLFVLVLGAGISSSAFSFTIQKKTPRSKEAKGSAALRTGKGTKEEFRVRAGEMKKFASQALTAKEATKVATAAESLLKSAEAFKSDLSYGNALHHAHLVLGRASLLKGDIGGAKRQLKLAGEVAGSPQLKSFGPNMTLARELLKKGEKDAVLQYIDQVQVFWKSETAREKCAAWKKKIASGKIPDFGMNRWY